MGRTSENELESSKLKAGEGFWVVLVSMTWEKWRKKACGTFFALQVWLGEVTVNNNSCRIWQMWIQVQQFQIHRLFITYISRRFFFYYFIFKLYNIVYLWRIPGDSWKLLFVWFYPYLLPNHLDLIFKFSTFFGHFQTKTGISHHYNITLLTVIIWKKQRPI